MKDLFSFELPDEVHMALDKEWLATHRLDQQCYGNATKDLKLYYAWIEGARAMWLYLGMNRCTCATAKPGELCPTHLEPYPAES